LVLIKAQFEAHIGAVISKTAPNVVELAVIP
jgi:hypothetical protein